MNSPEVTPWSWTGTVAKMKQLHFRWEQVMVCLLNEAWWARLKITTDPSVPDDKREVAWHTWCNQSGFDPETLEGWLQHYNPHTHMLSREPIHPEPTWTELVYHMGEEPEG